MVSFLSGLTTTTEMFQLDSHLYWYLNKKSETSEIKSFGAFSVFRVIVKHNLEKVNDSSKRGMHLFLRNWSFPSEKVLNDGP